MKASHPSFRHIIWGWNGTLLNDKWLCIESICTLLRARNLPAIDEDRYSRIFGFPVKDYYQAAGFDFSVEPFEKPAMEFIRLYDSRKKECQLHPGAVEILEQLSKMGCSQYLLSASETGILTEMTGHFGISGYFKMIKGLDNHYANGKGDLGMELLSAIHAPTESIVMIGDTSHDKEVADILGVSSILYTKGHYPAFRLMDCGTPLINNLDELVPLISGV